MTEILQLTEVALMVVEMTETLTNYTVTFERVEWYVPSGEEIVDGENAWTEPTDALMPGAKYVRTGEGFSLRLGDVDGLTVGGHLRLHLEAVPNRDQDDEL